MQESYSRLKRLLLLSTSIFLAVTICLLSSYIFLRKNPISRRPDLEPVGGLPDGCEWQFQDGPDFYIYQANCPDDTSGVGIYFGNMPNFDLPKGVFPKDFPRKPGCVASRHISWIVLDGKEDITVHPFYRTAIFEYQYSIYVPLKLHVWVFAESEGDLEELLHSLEDLRIRRKL